MSQPVRRALISVFDKDGLVDFARRLAAAGVELVSSGGTARLLEESGIPVVHVSDYTGSPEMLDGRVKTLHPRIHAGILAVRSNAEHMKDLAKHKIDPIDLVVVNLYPFEKTAATAGIGLGDVIEMIDIGGPTMVRAAAKNFQDVGVVVDPADYTRVVGEIEENSFLTDRTRIELAAKAFRHTSAYDTAVFGYFASRLEDKTDDASPFPNQLALEYLKIQDMRYGENPHQQAAFFRDPLAAGPSVATAKQLQGKELSFNNILDLDAALNIVADFSECACAIIKHGNPCGAALAPSPRDAFENALQCDPMSAFGGVIAVNRPVDSRMAEGVAKTFFEAIIAPSFDEEARTALAKKKNLRLLEVGDLSRFQPTGFDLRRVAGGILAQEWDRCTEDVREARVVTQRRPTEAEWKGLAFAWILAKHVKSNAIVYTSDDRTLAIGAGQMSRVDSARIAVQKAQSSLVGAIMASDAFFPFRDGIDAAAKAGIAAVVQPGGSIRDDEVIAAADEHGMTMVFTGRRHFRH